MISTCHASTLRTAGHRADQEQREWDIYANGYTYKDQINIFSPTVKTEEAVGDSLPLYNAERWWE